MDPELLADALRGAARGRRMLAAARAEADRLGLDLDDTALSYLTEAIYLAYVRDPPAPQN